MPEPTKYFPKSTFRLLFGHARRYPRLLWPIFVTVPITVILSDFVQPFVTAQILNRLSTGAYDHANLWASFGPQLAIFAVAAILSGVVGWRISLWFMWNLDLRVTRDIYQRVFNHLMNLSAGFHSNRFAGSLVSQTNKLSGGYSRIADATTFSLIPLIIAIIGTVLILAPRAPLYVAILMGLTLIYIIGTVHFSRSVRAANIAESAIQSRQTGYLADSISNVYAVKTFSAAKFEGDRFWDVSTQVRDAGRRSMYATITRENYASMITQGMLIAALVIAVVGVGQLRANIGTIFLIVTYTSSLAHHLWEFQGILRQFNKALGDASDMVAILRIKPDIKDPARPQPPRMFSGGIDFRDVTFTHGESDDPLFHNLNLSISPGEKIGLVGRSGSGKTTLTRLLLRFADLDSGAIEIDGQNITKVTQDNLRRAISYVPQEPLLFHRTLEENIAYGKPEASAEGIRLAARRAHADEFINKLPLGYETLVGERGVKLSGGQRQRVAIARAMLKDAPILVLDEATSALDSESEKLIQNALWRLMEGRTAIVIAHRLSTIQHMDRIIVLEDGHILEQGSHAELLAAGGQYASLWGHQSGGFIGEDDSRPDVVADRELTT